MADVVETSAGPVRGVRADGVVAFKGVPYGDDTSGEGRFRRPGPPQPWDEVRDCTDYGPSCPQMAVGQMTGQDLPDEIEQWIGVWTHERQVGEDCLVLNVWTPATDDRRRPVLVWLHGGGMSVGSASWPQYDGTNLVRANDVVMVGVNHRLGILGFLDLSHLGADFAESGNVGMLDIVAALEWVRDNIARFGGDPENVTIFGQSGGGAKVTCLLAMPEARGLFRSAFAMSGAVLQLRTLEASREATDEVLELLGVGADVDALRSLDAGKLVEASLSLMGQGTVALTRRGFDPALGPSLPRHPVDAVRAGSAAGVNVVLGCTTHEMASFMPADVWGDDDDATRERAGLMGEGAEHRLESYRRIRPDEPLASLLVLMISDVAFRIPHVRYADALIEGGGEAPWVYLYGYMQPGPDGIPRSGHGGDTPYFFNNVDKAPVMAGPQAGPLTAITSGALVGLARTGNPNHPAIPAWPRYSTTRRPTMVFDVEPRVEDDPMSAEREIWDGTEVPDLA